MSRFDRLTREEAQALDPGPLLEGGLGRDASETARMVAPIALVEQLRLDGVPLAGLEMWVARLNQFIDEGAASPERLGRLREDLLFLAQGYPRFERWATAIGPWLTTTEAVEGALLLAVKARQIWILTEALRQADPSRIGRK